MSRRWYNREKARETIRMAMDSALRRHHPKGRFEMKRRSCRRNGSLLYVKNGGGNE